MRVIRSVPMLCLAAALGAPAPACAEWFGGIFGGSKETRSTDRTRVAERGQIDFVRLETNEAGADNAHPIKLAPPRIKTALTALQWVEQGRKPVRLFTDDEAEFLAAGLAQALARATPREDVVFLTTGKHVGGIVMPRVGNSGRAFYADGKLQLLVAEAHVNYIGEARGAGLDHRFAHGSRNNASRVTLDLPREIGMLAPGRNDWAALSIAPAAVPDAAAPAGEPVRDEAFFERQATRLRGLKKLLDDGLISEEEYQLKRRKVLDGL